MCLDSLSDLKRSLQSSDMEATAVLSVVRVEKLEPLSNLLSTGLISMVASSEEPIRKMLKAFVPVTSERSAPVNYRMIGDSVVTSFEAMGFKFGDYDPLSRFR